MSETVEISKRPTTRQLYMIAGWRQWADAGSVSSGLPQYLIQQTRAEKIGAIRPEGFYLFQIPGTHDLVRPVVQFDKGYPKSLESRRNEVFYTGDDQRGVVIFLGDEPHLDVERYTSALLHIAQSLGVKRIIGLGGVYGELPYDKERMVSCSYSLPQLKDELNNYAVNFSDYHGGASIGSYVCRRAGDQGMEFVGLYAFVPTYDFSRLAQVGTVIRVENDFSAWLGIMRRINHMLKLGIDLADLKQKAEDLLRQIEGKVSELEGLAPQLGVREYLARLSEQFTESPFEPLDDIWNKELGRLLEDFDPDDAQA